MEAGVGVVDGVHVEEEVKGVKDGISEPVVEERIASGHHGRKESEGDDVFEEAIEGSLVEDDDGAHQLTEIDTKDVAGTSSADFEIAGESVSPEVNEKVTEDAVEVFHEDEGLEKGNESINGQSGDGVSLANVSGEGGTTNGDDFVNAHVEEDVTEESKDQVENESMIHEEDANGDEPEHLIAEERGTSEGTDQDGSGVALEEDVTEESKEELKNESMDQEHEVNRDGPSEGTDHDGSGLALEEDVTEDSKEDVENEPVDAKGDEPEHLIAEERGISDATEVVGGEPQAEETAVEKAENGLSNEVEIAREISESDGLVQELKDANAVVCGNHVDRASGEPGNGTDAVSSVSPADQSGELEEPSVISVEDDGNGEMKVAPASFNLNHKGSNGIMSDVASSNNLMVSQNGDSEKPGNNLSALVHGHLEGGPKAEDAASVDDTSVEKGELPMKCEAPLQDSAVRKNDHAETVKPTSGRESNSPNQPLPSGEDIDDTREYHVVEEQLTKKIIDEGKKVAPASREIEIKPAAASNSSSGRSANPVLPPARPAGLGRAAPLLEPAPRVVPQPRSNGVMSQVQAQQVEDTTNGEANEGDETREKLQMIRVKFLRLAHRLGQTPHNVVVAQVLYRLGLAEQLRGRPGGRTSSFSFDRASAMAEQLEATGQEPLDFACTIMVLGKTGVGKSATINSIFDEVKFGTDAFQLGTKKVQDVVGTVQGIKVRVIDTPGLLPSCSDQRQNEKVLHSVKRFMKKTPPDIVLYLDRLDMQSRDFGDMPLLRTITEIFGPSIWFNAIVVLTHAASAPPEGPNGTASTYDMFVTQRSHAVQLAIRQAAGDMRLMNPVSLVENHSACRTNRAGQRVLPNGQVWKPHLLLLSFASKILAEANTLLKLQDTPPGKPFSTRSKSPPLPFLLSSLLQSRPQLKLPEEQYGDDDAIDDDLDESSDSDEESEYDELPPFRHLSKAQLAKLTKDQRKAYYEELEYREKLFMKKQLKEEKMRRKMMKKRAEFMKELPGDYNENAEEEGGGAASVPVPMPDLALPASFDSDNPTHRYRYLDNSNQWLVRPVLDAHGWDHDVGYEGINVERLFVVKDKVPLSFSGQVSKDKKEANLQMEVAGSIKHGEGKATTLGFDMQSVGKDMAYTLRSETRFSNYRRNKATAGLSFTLLGDALSAGMKVEDKLIVNKRFRLVASAGAMTGRGDVAYGGSLEATLRDKDHPLGRSLSSLGLSVMDWHGDLAIGCNIQSQIPVGRSSNLTARANLNNRGSGQVSIRLNSSEQLQLVLIGLIPLLRKLTSQPQQYPFGH